MKRKRLWSSLSRVVRGHHCKYSLPPLSCYISKWSGIRKKLLLDAADSFRLGFEHLNPQFGIRCSGNDRTRLPSACKSFQISSDISHSKRPARNWEAEADRS